MNNDLISRSALLKKKTRMTEYDETGCGVHVYVVLAEDVEAAPAVDAEPVRRGRWLETNKRFKGIYQCSVCGSYLTMTSGALADGRKDYYCPNCGATMDAEVE